MPWRSWCSRRGASGGFQAAASSGESDEPAALPGVGLDFHCRDLEGIVAEGRKVNPEVVWHTDDSCFDDGFDLVIFSAVLQYIPDWQGLLRHAARSTRRHCVVAGTPIVER